MRKIILLVGILFLISCKPACKEGEEYICGKGCVTKVVTTQSQVVPLKQEEVKEISTPRKIPTYTPFKISDIVCVWGKEEGVVIDIKYGTVPEGHDDVLVYIVQFPENGRADGEYYETELEKGKCNSY